MAELILVFLTSFFVVLYSTPALIKVAILKRLFDEPGERKIHKRAIPTIGGIIIFAATLFSFCLWYELDLVGIQSSEELVRANQYIKEFKLIIATLLVMFFVGVKDDIIGTAPIKKLIAHVLVGLILVLMGDIRITGLHGIFAVYQIPFWGSVFLSLFTYIVVVNAFNLIDGVDGLAAGVGMIVSSTFAVWFILANDYIMAALAIALAGSLYGFLVFNFNPAKLFMGDSGSLTVGLLLCVMAIKVIEYPVANLNGVLLHLSKPVFVIAALIYPLTDTLRIFTIRAIRGISPFSADRNHLHHRLIDCGLNHKTTVIIIYIFNVLIVGVSIATWQLNPSLSLAILVASTALCVYILHLIHKAKNKFKQTEIEFRE